MSDDAAFREAVNHLDLLVKNRALYRDIDATLDEVVRLRGQRSVLDGGSPVVGMMLNRRTALCNRIFEELTRAYGKHGTDQWGRHEFYAILLEEVDELWDAIKRDESQRRVEEELVQVVAMCFRYFETGDRYRAPSAHPEEAR